MLPLVDRFEVSTSSRPTCWQTAAVAPNVMRGLICGAVTGFGVLLADVAPGRAYVAVSLTSAFFVASVVWRVNVRDARRRIGWLVALGSIVVGSIVSLVLYPSWMGPVFGYAFALVVGGTVPRLVVNSGHWSRPATPARLSGPHAASSRQIRTSTRRTPSRP